MVWCPNTYLALGVAGGVREELHLVQLDIGGVDGRELQHQLHYRDEP